MPIASSLTSMLMKVTPGRQYTSLDPPARCHWINNQYLMIDFVRLGCRSRVESNFSKSPRNGVLHFCGISLEYEHSSRIIWEIVSHLHILHQKYNK